MAVYTKHILSGSSAGRMIKVAATATLGTTIHAQSGSTYDELWLWAVNSDTTRRKLTVEFGGTSAPDDLIEVGIDPEDGLYLVVPGLILTSTSTVRAFAETANVVMIAGYLNRIT